MGNKINSIEHFKINVVSIFKDINLILEVVYVIENGFGNGPVIINGISSSKRDTKKIIILSPTSDFNIKVKKRVIDFSLLEN